jgi:hypothetical protein
MRTPKPTQICVANAKPAKPAVKINLRRAANFGGFPLLRLFPLKSLVAATYTAFLHDSRRIDRFRRDLVGKYHTAPSKRGACGVHSVKLKEPQLTVSR